MSIIQSSSTSNPLDNSVLALAIDLILKAESMGILSTPVDTLKLDLESLIRAVKDIASLGIGVRVVVNPDRWREYSADDLCTKLRALSQILEESPQPTTEWKKMRELFSDEMLSNILAVSEQSIRRYAAQERATPDEVASRLHWLALVVGDLHGAYNSDGVRKWFIRPRKSFGNSTPLAMLVGHNWAPTDRDAVKIRNFAHSLIESMGT
jgi:hypothetical protein